jgi:hypothetical protein
MSKALNFINPDELSMTCELQLPTCFHFRMSISQTPCVSFLRLLPRFA